MNHIQSFIVGTRLPKLGEKLEGRNKIILFICLFIFQNILFYKMRC